MPTVSNIKSFTEQSFSATVHSTKKKSSRPKIFKRKCLTACALSVIFFTIAYYHFPLLYETNDDSAIQMILSGSLSGGEPEAHAIYINYALALLISTLFRFVSTVPWWTLTHILVLFISICLFNYTLLAVLEEVFSQARNDSVKKTAVLCLVAAAACLIIDFSIFLYPVLRLQFSLTPAVSAGCSIFSCVLLLDCLHVDESSKKITNVLRILLSVSAFTFRVESGLIGLIYLAMLVLLLVIYSKKKIVDYSVGKNTVAMFAVIAVLIAGLYIGDRIAYSTDEWKEFEETNTARSLFMDYPHPSFANTPEIYESVGWSEIDYQLVSNWCFMDERYSREAFETIRSLYNTNSNSGEINWIDDWLLRTSQFSSLVFAVYFTSSIGITLVTIAFMSKGAARRIVVLGGIIGLALITYLSFKGRFLFHAAFPVLFPMSMLSVACAVVQHEKYSRSAGCSEMQPRANFGLTDVAAAVGAMVFVISSIEQNGGFGRTLYLAVGVGTLILIAIRACNSRRCREASSEASKTALLAAYVTVLVCMLMLQGGALPSRLGYSDSSTARQIQANESFARGKAYVETENNTVFIVPTVEYSTTDPFVTHYPANMFAWGGWPYYTPWRQDAMSNGDHVLSLLDLLDNPNIMLMTQNRGLAMLTKSYLEEQAGEEVRISENKCDGLTTYSFELTE